MFTRSKTSRQFKETTLTFERKVEAMFSEKKVGLPLSEVAFTENHLRECDVVRPVVSGRRAVATSPDNGMSFLTGCCCWLPLAETTSDGLLLPRARRVASSVASAWSGVEDSSRALQADPDPQLFISTLCHRSRAQYIYTSTHKNVCLRCAIIKPPCYQGDDQTQQISIRRGFYKFSA